MQLRYYQQGAINAFFAYFQAGNVGNPLIAAPTGIGKSYMIAGLIQQIMHYWPFQRFIVATHDKRLIEQDAKALLSVWPSAPVGIYSAGLKTKQTANPIIFGGIASMINAIPLLGHRDILIIDEAHLVSPVETTQYRRFIAELLLINPKLKVLGLTATPYRLGQGLIIDDGLFTDTIYDLTAIEPFNRLIDEGFLCPLVSKPTNVQLDISQVGIAQGELKQDQLQKAVDIYEVTFAALTETIEKGFDRKCWLGFASGIDHAEHISEILNNLGISSAAVHSKKPQIENDKLIAKFKAAELRAIINYKMLTTGFDHAPIDLILDLYPTISPARHVQKWGRGTRPWPTKTNTLALDFGGNIARLGPINDPKIPRKKGKGTGDAPIRICDQCGAYNHASARYCGRVPYPSPEGCGHEFTFEIKVTSTASNAEILRNLDPVVEWFDVTKVEYFKDLRIGDTGVIKAIYHCGQINRFTELVNFETRIGLFKHQAYDWLRNRYQFAANEPMPTLNDEVLQVCARLRIPKRLRVHVNLKYPKILNAEF